MERMRAYPNNKKISAGFVREFDGRCLIQSYRCNDKRDFEKRERTALKGHNAKQTPNGSLSTKVITVSAIES